MKATPDSKALLSIRSRKLCKIHILSECLSLRRSASEPTGSQPVKTLVLWQPPEPLSIGQGNWKKYINQLLEDLPGLNIEDIVRAGNNGGEN